MNKPDRRKRRFRLNALATLGSVVLVSVYMITIGFNPSSPIKTPGDSSGRPQADKIATQLQLTRFTEKGEIDHTLTTARAEFYRDESALQDANNGSDDSFIMPTQGQAQTSRQDYALLARPQMIVYRGASQQTRISSIHGTYYPAQQLVELNRDVVVTDQETHSQLETESLTVDAGQKQILTEDHVTLSNSGSRTTATGLQGNLTQQRWQLLADVKSTITADASETTATDRTQP